MGGSLFTHVLTGCHLSGTEAGEALPSGAAGLKWLGLRWCPSLVCLSISEHASPDGVSTESNMQLQLGCWTCHTTSTSVLALLRVLHCWGCAGQPSTAGQLG